MWAKLDDGFFDHPKARAAGTDGRALFVASLCWAGRSQLEGVIDKSVLQLLAAKAEVKPAATARRLVEVGLWEEHPDGWLVHDYLDYNPSADKVREIRQKRAEAGRRGGSKPKQPPSRPEANCLANDEAGAEAQSKRNRTPSSSSSSSYENPHPQTTSSGGDPPNEDEEQQPVGRRARAEAACDLIAGQRHQTRVDAGKVTNLAGHLRACRESARTDHLARAHELAHEHPDATPEQIAGQILGTPSPAPGPGEPEPAALYREQDERRRVRAAEGPTVQDRPTNLGGIAAARAALTTKDPDHAA